MSGIGCLKIGLLWLGGRARRFFSKGGMWAEGLSCGGRILANRPKSRSEAGPGTIPDQTFQEFVGEVGGRIGRTPCRVSQSNPRAFTSGSRAILTARSSRLRFWKRASSGTLITSYSSGSCSPM